MKFNIGQWVIKPGVTAHNCEQIRDYRLSADKKSLYLFILDHRRTGANLDGPALELTVTSPQEDMIRIQAVHFKGDRKSMSNLILTTGSCPWSMPRTRKTSPSPPAKPAWSSRKPYPAALHITTKAGSSPRSAAVTAPPCSALWIPPKDPLCVDSCRWM